MKLTRDKVFSLLPAVLGILLSVGVMTVFSACGMEEHGKLMPCHGAQNAAELGGFVLFFLFSFGAILKGRGLKLFLFADLTGSELTYAFAKEVFTKKLGIPFGGGED